MNPKKSELKSLKQMMALQGYYLPSDYARLIGKTRQWVNKIIGNLITIEKEGRAWVKFDSGELGIKNNPEYYKAFHAFLSFGFTRHTKSIFINNKATCELKQISEDTAELIFNNDVGSRLSIIINTGQIKQP